MTLTTYEGIVEKGKIRLKTGIRLPENAKVYVIVPDLQVEKKKTIRVRTPRLANRKQAGDFKMKVDKA
jgi:molybdopterin biosynthesis enzyme